MVADTNIDFHAHCYNGNVKLKRGGVNIPYTQEQIEEYLRCKNDIVYFVRNYVKIISLDKGLVLFDLYPFQEEMIRAFKRDRYSINLLSRQSGKTTSVAAYLLYETMFNANLRVAVLANKGDTAREILDRIKKMYEELPWFLKPGVIEWNKGSVEFSNGSRILSAATSSSSIRGQSMNIIYLDELAFIQNDVEFFASTYPVITSGKTTKVIITSTPKGMNLFYKLWTDAKEGRNSFVPHEYLWYHHPERDEKWKEETLRNISQMQFDQEFECEFFGSTNTLISGSKLQRMTFEDPIRRDENFSVWEDPIAGHSYVVTVDVSEGVGLDYSVVNVFDVTTQPYKQVAVWRNNQVVPVLLAEIVHRILKMYLDAYCIVETNSVGRIVADSLFFEYEYDNMFQSVETKGRVKIAGNGSENGLRQTQRTKAAGCSALKSMIESDVLLIKDFNTLNELSTFVKKRNSFEAEQGKNDDLVMTLVTFCWFATQPFFEEMTDANVRGAIRERMLAQEENSHLVFGFYDDGIVEDGEVVEDLSLVRKPAKSERSHL